MKRLTYVPKNASVYLAAYNGALAGMLAGRAPIDVASTDYDVVSAIAGVFAESLDTTFAAGLPDVSYLNDLTYGAIATQSLGYFTGRAVPATERGPKGPKAIDASFFDGTSGAISAIVLSGGDYVSSVGVVPTPTPGNVSLQGCPGTAGEAPSVTLTTELQSLLPSGAPLSVLPNSQSVAIAVSAAVAIAFGGSSELNPDLTLAVVIDDVVVATQTFGAIFIASASFAVGGAFGPYPATDGNTPVTVDVQAMVNETSGAPSATVSVSVIAAAAAGS